MIAHMYQVRTSVAAHGCVDRYVYPLLFSVRAKEKIFPLSFPPLLVFCLFRRGKETTNQKMTEINQEPKYATRKPGASLADKSTERAARDKGMVVVAPSTSSADPGSCGDSFSFSLFFWLGVTGYIGQ